MYFIKILRGENAPEDFYKVLIVSHFCITGTFAAARTYSPILSIQL